ncbi:MAG: hypothetical protein MUC49_15715 [Raineya sp.]|jgi:hypothetical protein|nr:hypothetical protein [Raineya sp.]
MDSVKTKIITEALESIGLTDITVSEENKEITFKNEKLVLADLQLVGEIAGMFKLQVLATAKEQFIEVKISGL